MKSIDQNFIPIIVSVIIFCSLEKIHCCSSKHHDNDHTGCPRIQDIPVMNDTENEFVCCRTWDGWGDSEEVGGCNVISWTGLDKYRFEGIEGKMFGVGSLIVKAGCTYYGYKDYNFKGDVIKYSGPETYPDGCIGKKCPPDGAKNPEIADGFRSMECQCEQEPIDCDPSDEWNTVHSCDFSQSSTTGKCTYSKTIGTTWSNEVSESMSIDVTIESALSATFFRIFSTELSVSASTGYDWTRTSSQAKSEAVTTTVEVDVPPYTRMDITAVQGYCGGSQVNTELYKVTTSDKEGNIISETFEPQNFPTKTHEAEKSELASRVKEKTNPTPNHPKTYPVM